MRKTLVLVFGIGLAIPGICQKYASEKAFVSFFSDAAVEDIAAENTKAVSLYNAATGDIVFSIPINEYEFEKSLMKEHFHEKYMETEKFPKSTFQGKLTPIQLDKAGEQQTTASGKLTIHGVTNTVEVPGTAELVDGKLVLKAKFIVKLSDYKIEIPKLLWQNIAEQVEVKVEFTYKPQ